MEGKDSKFYFAYYYGNFGISIKGFTDASEAAKKSSSDTLSYDIDTPSGYDGTTATFSQKDDFTINILFQNTADIHDPSIVTRDFTLSNQTKKVINIMEVVCGYRAKIRPSVSYPMLIKRESKKFIFK